MRRLLLLMLLLLLPDWAQATTYWYRPGFDSVRTPLTYGTGTGASRANAKAGFAEINAGTVVYAPDDIICLSNEPYYGEQLNYQTLAESGTAGHPIKISGCDAVVSGDGLTSTGKAILWSASDLTGNLSYTAAKAQINNATYAWSTVATDIYKKRIDVRPITLYEDDTWLEPYWTGVMEGAGNAFGQSCYDKTEAEILAALPAGKWCNKNNGDSTYRLYYHSTTGSKNPTNTTIRVNAIPLDTTSLAINVANYMTWQDIEFRGHGSLTNQYALNVANANHFIGQRLLFERNLVAIAIRNGTGVFTVDVLLKDTQVLHSGALAVAVRGATSGGTDGLVVDGGNYSYSNAFYYNGNQFQGFDGDGIGNGFEGGTFANFVFKNFTCEGNYNYCIYYGTDRAMTMQNLTIESVTMNHNRRGCFKEGTGEHVTGTLRISGVICAYNGDLTGMPFYGPTTTWPIDIVNDTTPAFEFGWQSPTARQIIVENVTFVGNRNTNLIYLLDDVNNQFHLRNIIFYNNPGHATTDRGDLFYQHNVALDSNDTFQNITFDSAANSSRVILKDNTSGISYRYNSGADQTALTALLSGSALVYNVDPLLTSATDFRPQLGSPVLQSGINSATCRDVRSAATVCANPPDKGAYQTLTGDPSDSSGSPPNITTTALPGGYVTVAYGQTLGKSGGLAPFVWSKQSGTFPTGLSLTAATGLIDGTPTTPGVYTFVPQVTDNSARTDTTPPTLSITILANPIVITTNALLSGNVSRAYVQALTATGGNGSITWAILNGTLPTGLSMDTAGAITGTPSVLGTSSFTVRATDSVGTIQDKALSITILAALVLSTPDTTVTCPSTVVSPNVCWYVRPDTDGATDLNYGSEDGTSYATAFDGMAAITGMAAGDVICFPGMSEPFYEIFTTVDAGKAVSGTLRNRITYQGCGTTKSLWWSARLFHHDRSYDAARAVVTGSAYEWVALGNDVYRKKIEIIPKELWAGESWVQPRVIYTMSEAAILAYLNTGEWGVRDFGDSTYRVYYRASLPALDPASVVMRIDLLAATGAFGHIRQNYITLKNIEMRGHRSPSSGRTIQMFGAHHTTLDSMLFYKNQECWSIAGNDPTTPVTDFRALNVDCLYNTQTGPHIAVGDGGSDGSGVLTGCWGSVNAGTWDGCLGADRLLVDGGNYSYNGYAGDATSGYIGTGWLALGDGDGIGIGQTGGPAKDIIIRNIRADFNRNYGVFVGTNNKMTITNFSLLGARMDGNVRGCFSEGNGADIVGVLIVAGFTCLNSVGDIPLSASMKFSSDFSDNDTPNQTAPRTVIVESGTFSGNHNASRIQFEANLYGGHNLYRFKNLVFDNNFVDVTGNDHGDLYSYTTALLGSERFDHLFFYSKPNTSGEFAELGTSPTTSYRYNVGGDLAAFATATGGTNLTINTNPLFISATDFRTQAGSPLRGAGAISGYCKDARGSGCSPDHPDLGGYQASGRDPAPTRSVRP